MGKRKGAPTSRERTSSQRESEAKTSEEGVEDERDQLRREISSFEGKRAEVSEKERELETIQRKDKKRKRQEQLTSLRLEVEQAQQNMPAKRKRLKDVCATRKVENTQRLDKLPPEVWEKIFGNLDENDLFPLALSCRYFRQKQKELVERVRQSGPRSGAPRFALRTNLRKTYEKDEPASAEYVRFCSKEKLSSDDGWKKAMYISYLAVFHGDLPLLQELLADSQTDPKIIRLAGKSSSSQSLLLLSRLLTSFSLSPLHSARRPIGDFAMVDNPEGV